MKTDTFRRTDGFLPKINKLVVVETALPRKVELDALVGVALNYDGARKTRNRETNDGNDFHNSTFSLACFSSRTFASYVEVP